MSNVIDLGAQRAQRGLAPAPADRLVDHLGGDIPPVPTNCPVCGARVDLRWQLYYVQSRLDDLRRFIPGRALASLASQLAHDALYIECMLDGACPTTCVFELERQRQAEAKAQKRAAKAKEREKQAERAKRAKRASRRKRA